MKPSISYETIAKNTRLVDFSEMREMVIANTVPKICYPSKAIARQTTTLMEFM